MEDDVRAAADAGEQRDGVVERLRRQDLGRARALPCELDGAATRLLRRLLSIRVTRRDRRGAGEAHSERLDGAGHRRGRAHLVAVPARASGDTLQFVELLARHAAGA